MVNGFDQRLAAYSADTGRPVFCLQDWLQEPDGSSIVPSDVHLFVLQAGLAKLWRSWGIEPDVVLGFGAGQYTAACAAGGLCFNDAVILIAERENVLATLDGNAQEFNGSGFDESMLSDSVKTALNSFEALADKFNYYPANLPLICSLSGHTVPVHRSLGGSYWRQQCLARQMLTESLETLANLDCDYILELGPVGAGKPGFLETVPAKRLRSLSSDTGVATSMRDTLGQLYVAGANPNFKALYESRKRRRISMPTYPFQKKRYWITEIADCTEEKIEV
jgi:acyl transferase domain-containing protein